MIRRRSRLGRWVQIPSALFSHYRINRRCGIPRGLSLKAAWDLTRLIF